MSKIRDMLIDSSAFLHVLMEILILHFCVMINVIFGLIKAKLLYFLNRLERQIDFDEFLLSVELASLELLLSELQTDLRKYLSISKLVNQFLKPLVRLTEDNKKLMKLIKVIEDNKTIINKLDHNFSYQNHRISKTLKLLSSIKLERSIKSTRDKNPELVMNLKINLGKLKKNLSAIINSNSDKELIVKVQKKEKFKMTASIKKVNGSKDNGIQNVQESINKLLDQADEEVSKEIMSILGQLLKVETMNLVKLYKLMAELQLKYYIILIRGELLVCTIEFYEEIEPTIKQLFRLMKFDCRNACGFLRKCSEVEKYIRSTSDQIDSCIEKLATSLNGCKSLGLGPELLNLYSKIIEIVGWLKFYMDLIAREILIFKMIIINLIVMTVSSFILDSLMLYIASIGNIDSAIKTLMTSYWYLKTFYYIQLKNTLVIFGLSNQLRFTQAINEHYKVLLYDLDLINRLIWAIEC